MSRRIPELGKGFLLSPCAVLMGEVRREGRFGKRFSQRRLGEGGRVGKGGW